MCDLNCDVVKYYAWSCDIQYSLYDNILIENPDNKQDGKQRNYYMNFRLKDGV